MIRTKVGRVMSRSLAKSWAALGQGKDHQKSRSHAVNAKTIRGACNNTHHLRNRFTFYFGHPKTYTQVIPPILADSAVEHQDFSCSTGCSFPTVASRIYFLHFASFLQAFAGFFSSVSLLMPNRSTKALRCTPSTLQQQCPSAH